MYSIQRTQSIQICLTIARICILTLSLCLFPYDIHAVGITYYVSPTGNDSNNGTQNSPYKTLKKATTRLSPGDTLFLAGGTYTEPLDVPISGTSDNPITIKAATDQHVVIDVQRKANYTIRISGNYVNIIGPRLIATGSKWAGIQMIGHHILIDNLEVTNSMSHGVIAFGKYITVKHTKIHGTVRENEKKTKSGGWGSALKVERGAENILYEQNDVYHNYGEGIATTMGKNVEIRNNRVYDNFSVNIYVDNSSDVLVENNFVSCNTDEEAKSFYRDGNPAASIALAEETYSGWGNQLRNVTIRNNIAGFCGNGISYRGAESGIGGLRAVTIVQNTFYGVTKNPIYIEHEPQTANSVITNNIFHSTGRPPSISNRTGIRIDHNYWVGSLPAASTNARGDGDLSGNPGFITTPNTTDPNSYRVGAASLAIDTGTDTRTPTDFIGIARPQGSAYDMGAYEHISNTTGGYADADYYQDGKITIIDFVLFMNYWYTKNVNKGDLNHDNKISVIDYTVFMNLWHQFSQRL